MSKVSVLMITRNRAKLISRAIESVLNQNYRDLELVIVDGASTDNTTEVVESYCDSRIKYFKLPENLSVVDSINYAFYHSTGEYIAFLDDDDEYLPSKIDKEVRLLDSLDNNYGLVYCWFRQYDVRTGAVFNEHKTKLRGDVHIEAVSDSCVSGTPVIMIRRAVYEEMNGWRNDMGIISDWEFCARICQRYKVDFVPEILVNCYEHHGEHQMTYEKNYYKDRYEKTIQFHLMFLEEFKEVFDKYPTSKILHYKALIRAYVQLSQYKKAWSVYLALNGIKINFSNTIKTLIYFVRKNGNTI